jgi:hypothetical protein
MFFLSVSSHIQKMYRYRYINRYRPVGWEVKPAHLLAQHCRKCFPSQAHGQILALKVIYHKKVCEIIP